MTEQRGRVWASFIVSGRDLNPDEVSARFKIAPTESKRRGDARGTRFKYRHGFWELGSRGQVESEDLEAHVEWLINQLEPVASEVKALVSGNHVDGTISCFFELLVFNRGIHLSPRLLNRLAELNISLDFDIYTDCVPAKVEP